MPLLHARALFTRDRMDWNRPHLSWLNDRLYNFLRK